MLSKIARSFSFGDKTFFALGIIIFLSILVRLLIGFHINQVDSSRFFRNDSSKYQSRALILLDQGKFLATKPRPPHLPELYITPGYPLLMSLFIHMFGEHNYYYSFLIFQFFLFGFTLIPIYLLGKWLWNPQAGLLAAVLYSVDFTAFAYSFLVLTETIFVFCFCWMLACGVAAVKEKRHRLINIFLFALLFVTTLYIRPVMLYVTIPLILGLVLAGKYSANWSWRSVINTFICLLLIMTTLVGAWIVRNGVQTGVYQFSTAGMYLMFTRRVPMMLAYKNHSTPTKEAQKLVAQIPNFSQLTQKEIYLKEKAMVSYYVRRYPQLYLKQMTMGIIRMMIVPGEDAVESLFGYEIPKATKWQGPIGDLARLKPTDFYKKWTQPGYWPFLLFATLALGYLIIVYVTGFYGVKRALMNSKRFRVMHCVLLGVFLYILLVTGGYSSYARYRMPLMPIICLYAGIGLYELFKRKRELV